MLDEALFMLASLYDRNEEFVADCLQVHTAFGEALLASYAGDFDNWQECWNAIVALARRWNLDRVPEMADGDFAVLRFAIRQTGEKFGEIVGTPFRPCSMAVSGWANDPPVIKWGEQSWAWRLDQHETLAECRDRIAKALDVVPVELPDEVVRQLYALPDLARAMGWVLSDVPHELQKHVGWLFLRLCPQRARPLGAAEIAARESDFTHARTVRRAINVLAALMKIELPPMRPGRPRRANPASKVSAFQN